MRFKYRIRVPKLSGMGAVFPWTGPTGNPIGLNWNVPQGATEGAGPGPGGTPVVMPSYGGQCSVFGYSKDPRTGERINIQVAMPGGGQRTFATEAQFQAACGGVAGGGGSYAAPQVVSMPAAAPQNISISLPGSSGSDSAWLAELARRSAQQDELIRQLALQRQRSYTPETPQPQTSWVYTPGSGGGGVEYAPSMAVQPETAAIPPAPEKAATPWWIWAALGAGALYVVGKKVKT